MTQEEARLRGIINKLNLKVTKLEILLMDVKTDLLMRAEEDSEGMKVVGLSASIWIKVKKAADKGRG